MEHYIVCIQSRPVTIISEYMPPTDLLPAVQSESHGWINKVVRQDANRRTPLLQLEKGVAALQVQSRLCPSRQAALDLSTVQYRLGCW